MKLFVSLPVIQYVFRDEFYYMKDTRQQTHVKNKNLNSILIHLFLQISKENILFGLKNKEFSFIKLVEMLRFIENGVLK